MFTEAIINRAKKIHIKKHSVMAPPTSKGGQKALRALRRLRGRGEQGPDPGTADTR